MKTSPRSQKIAGLVQEHLTRIIPLHLTPDEVGFLTVCAVEVSGDLKVVDIFVSSLGGPDTFIKKLNKKGKAIAAELQRRLDMRQTFILRFKIDKSVEHVAKMRKLME
ncbi:MAG TPA: 30S ribosome-binding factor RbfA [Candidatus Gracilibacteria bacterium]